MMLLAHNDKIYLYSLYIRQLAHPVDVVARLLQEQASCGFVHMICRPKEQRMSDRAYRDLYYEEPHVQAEFERLVQRIRDAERAREPIGSRQRQAEREEEA